jgi:DNA ligase 1
MGERVIKPPNDIKSVILTLTKIAATSSRTEKEFLLKANDCELLRKLITAAYDPTVTYGIRVAEEEFGYVPNAHVDEFFSLLDELSSREITGNEAKEAVEDVLSGFDRKIQQWFIRVINRDLKIGCDVSTFNKVWPKLIPVFKLALCDKYDNEILPYAFLIERKLDGIRAVAGTNRGVPFIFSRSGKVISNVEEILRDIKKLAGDEDVVFDGELLGENWNETVHIVHSTKSKVDSSGLKFHIFDMLPFFTWQNQTSKAWLILRERKDLLGLKFKNAGFPATLRQVWEEEYVATPEEVWERAGEYVKQGFEGAVIKDPNSHYPFKRTEAWMKVKFFDSAEFVITGAEYGDAGTINENRLGRLILDVEGHETRVGTGFSSQQRDEYWELHKQGKLVGKKIEVKYQEITKDGALRFPSFLRIREDL